MTLVVCLIFLWVDALLAMGAMENNVLNQKMTAAFQAQMIAFNSAEAGLIAGEAQISGQAVDLSNIKGVLDYQISAGVIDECQQHTFTITSTATYQNAHVQLTSGYRQARLPSPPGCSNDPVSHRLWWQELNLTE